MQRSDGLLGIHIDMPGAAPPEVLHNLDPAPATLQPQREKVTCDRPAQFHGDGFNHAAMMNQSPQTVG